MQLLKGFLNGAGNCAFNSPHGLWNTTMIAGALATILYHEITLKKEATL